MHSSRRSFLLGTAAATAASLLPDAGLAQGALSIATPMDPPEWALLEQIGRAHV